MTMNNLSAARRNQLFLALVVLLVTSLNCNLPFLGESGASSEENLAETIAASGLLYVDQIEAGEDELRIEYQVFPEDSPEMIVSGWLTALIAAYEAVPEVGLYVLSATLDGEPYLEVTAQGIDLEGFVKEELPPDEFLARLEITDKRPTDDRAWDLLAEIDLYIDRISLSRGILTINYWPAPAENQAALMEEWWRIYDTLGEIWGSVEAIEIENQMVDGSKITVQAAVKDLEAYRDGELTALEFLAALGMEIEEIAGEE
jgi:hypothetical protein